jgi:hypothetical protein
MKITRLAKALLNLQLLEGTVNIEKRAALPDAWLRERYPSESDREHYRSIHLLGVVPEGIEGCEEFWAARRERLREKITAVLNPMALQTSQKVQEQDAAETGGRRVPRQAGARVTGDGCQERKTGATSPETSTCLGNVGLVRN